MNVIRIYFSPNGYKDIICDCVDVIPSTHQCRINGGEEDGVIYDNADGARAIRETAGIQETLF